MGSRPIRLLAQRVLLTALAFCVAQQQLRSGTCCCLRASSAAPTRRATASPPAECPFCARLATGAGKPAAMSGAQIPVSGRPCHCCRLSMADATKVGWPQRVETRVSYVDTTVGTSVVFISDACLALAQRSSAFLPADAALARCVLLGRLII